MKTIYVKNQTRNWYVIDAENKPLGRVAAKVAVTGSKKTDKMYYHHTGYVGGLKSFTFEKKIERHPEDPIMLAVKGMLPKGPLGRKLLSNLKVFAGAEHTHTAQNPQSLEV